MNGALQRRLLEERLVEVVQLVERIRRDLPGLVERAAIPSRFDGFPSSTGGQEGRGGGVSDPVYAQVAARAAGGDRDDVRTTVEASISELAAAVRHLRRVDDHRDRAVRLQQPERASVAADPAAGECINCDRFGVWSVVHKAHRCQACYVYRRRHEGRDAPASIVAARPEVPGVRHSRPS